LYALPLKLEKLLLISIAAACCLGFGLNRDNMLMGSPAFKNVFALERKS
jgi:hypothetical protein